MAFLKPLLGGNMDGQEGGLLGANSSPEKGMAIRAVAFYI